MEDPPHIDVVVAFDVEHEVRESIDRKTAKFWDVELVSEAQRAHLWIAADPSCGALDGIDETHGDRDVCRVSVVVGSRVEVSRSTFAEVDGLGRHDAQASEAIRPRSPEK